MEYTEYMKDNYLDYKSLFDSFPDYFKESALRVAKISAMMYYTCLEQSISDGRLSVKDEQNLVEGIKYLMVGMILLDNKYFLIDPESVPILRVSKLAAIGFNERFDGKGKPNKLKGDQIPLLSRIIAIVNYYDVYHELVPDHDKIIQALLANKKTLFDPFLVDMFINIIPEIDVIYMGGSYIDLPIKHVYQDIYDIVKKERVLLNADLVITDDHEGVLYPEQYQVIASRTNRGRELSKVNLDITEKILNSNEADLLIWLSYPHLVKSNELVDQLIASPVLDHIIIKLDAADVKGDEVNATKLIEQLKAHNVRIAFTNFESISDYSLITKFEADYLMVHKDYLKGNDNHFKLINSLVDICNTVDTKMIIMDINNKEDLRLLAGYDISLIATNMYKEQKN